MIIASFAEVISISAVIPFLGVLTSPEKVFEHHLSRPLINWLNFTEPKQLLLPITIAFVLGAIFSGSMRLILLWTQTRLSHAIGSDFSISIYRRTLYQPYSVHVARNSSEVIAGISNKVNSVVYQTLLPLLTIISSTMILLTILVALVAIEPITALAAYVGFGSLYAIVLLVTKSRLKRDSELISHEENQALKAMQEGLGGIRDVLLDGTQRTFCNIYSKADLPLRRALANVQIISGSPRPGIEALGMALIAVLALVLARRSNGISDAITVLGALALGAQRLLPQLQQSYSSWTSIRGGQKSLSDAIELLDQPLPEHTDAPSVMPINFEKNISLKNISFRYGANTQWVLKNFDLTIPKGSRIGFIGQTGSGKSTLLDIIMALLQPTEGSLEIDGVEITPLNHRSWQVHIAHVPQTIFLADTTIAGNIAFGIPDDQIDFVRLKEAAKKAQIAEIIESWDEQYETIVGERGIRLSGGQRQRIGIARALYKKADFIVFDEATSALDNDTERDVMDAIENLGSELTVVIVAHRLTTLSNCNQVIQLSDGKLLRIGTYEQIIKPVD